ncbi:LacI family DNA-binding transcriptional regulator [Pseudarthrobacter enclensis]|uniref:LacI family DNA-binding transcriptional regulator n=1 Tax=Pseudarthrobacter enclensis TaxID=993070 RepID=UPI0034285FFC
MSARSSSPGQRRATILDVAAAAGVSRQTVTRAMNGMPGISQATRERVQGLAAELGYTPSRFARGLVQGANVSVGLAIPDLTNPYFPAFASSVVEEATQRGWNVVVDDYGHGAGSALDSAARLAPQVDALIGYLGEHSRAAQAIMGRRPVVGLDDPQAEAAGSISFDYAHAARLGLGHLAEDRRRRIVFLDSDQGGIAAGRGHAVEAAARERDIRLQQIASGPSAAQARRAVTDLLAAAPDVDAILVFNDLMAAGVLKALSEGKRAVPRDVAVIGMDGIPLGELLTPELTTLSLDLRAVGRAAVGLLDGLLSGSVEPGSSAAALTLRHELVIRQSA